MLSRNACSMRPEPLIAGPMYGPACMRLCPNPHTATEKALFVAFRTDRQIRFISMLLLDQSKTGLVGWGSINGSFDYCRCSARQICRAV